MRSRKRLVTILLFVNGGILSTIPYLLSNYLPDMLLFVSVSFGFVLELIGFIYIKHRTSSKTSRTVFEPIAWSFLKKPKYSIDDMALIGQIAKHSGITKMQTIKVLDFFNEAIIEVYKKSGNVTIENFDTFSAPGSAGQGSNFEADKVIKIKAGKRTILKLNRVLLMNLFFVIILIIINTVVFK